MKNKIFITHATTFYQILILLCLIIIFFDASAQFAPQSKKAFEHLNHAESVIDLVDSLKESVKNTYDAVIKRKLPIPKFSIDENLFGPISKAFLTIDNYYQQYPLPKVNQLTINYVKLAQINDRSSRRRQISMAVLELQKVSDEIHDMEETNRNMYRTQILVEVIEKDFIELENMFGHFAAAPGLDIAQEFQAIWKRFQSEINPTVRNILKNSVKIQKEYKKVIIEQTILQKNVSNGLSAVLTAESVDITKCVNYWQTITDTLNTFNTKLADQATLVANLEKRVSAIQNQIGAIRQDISNLSSQYYSLNNIVYQDSINFIGKANAFGECCYDRCIHEQHFLTWNDPSIPGIKYRCVVSGCLIGWASGSTIPVDQTYSKLCGEIKPVFNSFKENHKKRKDVYNSLVYKRQILQSLENNFNRITQELQKEKTIRDKMAKELKSAITKVWENSEFKLCQILGQGNVSDQFRINSVP